MYKRRASAVIAVVVLGHVAALGLQSELWPFSHYPMYARPQSEWTFEAHRLYGISGTGDEVPLEQSSHFEPYGAYELSEVLAKAAPNPEKLDTALRSLLSWYEAERPVHGGPSLRGLRAYRVVYSISRQLDPRKREKGTLVSRVLLGEIAR